MYLSTIKPIRLVLGAGDGVGIVPGTEDGGNGGTTDTPPTPNDTKMPADKDPDKPLGEGGLKALQAERDARAEAERKAAELEARVRQFEDANKTTEEKAAERLAELERAATENAAKALRYEAAAKAELPLSAAGRLQGSTLDELVEDAKALKELLGATTHRGPAPDPNLRRQSSNHSASVEAGRARYAERHGTK
ncbi:MAG TPA: hypothetical protein VK028_13635 [Micromonosporaceae bacterium]|nr:hypothetical protein [Micromonosporaceae bacterium]